MSHPTHKHLFARFPILAALAMVATISTLLFLPADGLGQVTGNYVILVSNDLGMHCMNKDHHNMSILPPFNTLNAQVIKRGNGSILPEIITSGVTLEYSIPGNTHSVGKTDFWDYDVQLFGVDLPPNVGLKGKGLTGVFDPQGDMFIAEGIPLTPFPDATPTVEDPYQQALVVLKNDMGNELATSRPVVPVSTEVTCVTSGCHSSELSILNSHEREHGFDPNNRPILCASCHNSVVLTGSTAPGSEGYFSQVLHDKHSFIESQTPGITACQHCHPGPNARCLRGVMNTQHGMICQDCHGSMDHVASTIEHDGRIPWVDEPACRTCHTSAYGEPVGTRYRDARGHGGVMCTGCHNSPHAIFPSREARDNDVVVDLQGHAGTLSDCTVCHGTSPTGPGPHGVMAVAAVQDELFSGAGKLTIYPAPFQRGGQCTILAASKRPDGGKLLIYDVRGHTVRMLRSEAANADQARIMWDGRDSGGRDVASGVYFMRWTDGFSSSAGKLVIVD